MKKNKKLDYVKVNRKASREVELDDEQGWVQIHKVHKSKKNYSRKVKHRKLET